MGNETTVSMISEADIRTWLPGAPIQTSERIDLSTELPPGRYTLEVGLPGTAGSDPVTPPLPPTQLAMPNRTGDGFYPLSTIEVRAH